jgi:hypothetical protein
LHTTIDHPSTTGPFFLQAQTRKSGVRVFMLKVSEVPFEGQRTAAVVTVEPVPTATKCVPCLTCACTTMPARLSLSLSIYLSLSLSLSLSLFGGSPVGSVRLNNSPRTWTGLPIDRYVSVRPDARCHVYAFRTAEGEEGEEEEEKEEPRTNGKGRKLKGGGDGRRGAASKGRKRLPSAPAVSNHSHGTWCGEGWGSSTLGTTHKRTHKHERVTKKALLSDLGPTCD